MATGILIIAGEIDEAKRPAEGKEEIKNRFEKISYSALGKSVIHFTSTPDRNFKTEILDRMKTRLPVNLGKKLDETTSVRAEGDGFY